MQAAGGLSPAARGWLLLAGAAAIGAALAITSVPRDTSARPVYGASAEHTEAPLPDARELAPSDGHESLGGGGSEGPAVRPKRGITPPWRENAIPELRSQPGRRTKKYAA